MPTVLITGANRGIGLQFARDYSAEGWTVIATARSPEAADALRATGAETLPLDAADSGSIASLGARLSGRAIDLLVLNAGTYGPRAVAFGAAEAEPWLDVFRVNAIAPLLIAQALIDNLRAAGHARIAIVSSKMGSIGENSSGRQYIYRSSKAAVNAVGRSMAIDLKPMGIDVIVLHPGWVRTDMGGPGAAIDTATSVAGMRKAIAALTPDSSGSFVNYDGQDIPW